MQFLRLDLFGSLSYVRSALFVEMNFQLQSTPWSFSSVFLVLSPALLIPTGRNLWSKSELLQHSVTQPDLGNEIAFGHHHLIHYFYTDSQP